MGVLIAPGHDEYLDAYTRLNAEYRDHRLHPPLTTYIDPLGTGVWVGRYVELRQTLSHEPAIQTVQNEIAKIEGRPLPFPPPPVAKLAALTVRAGRLFNGSAYVGWRGCSEFSAIHLCRIGRQDELIRRLDRAATNGCNGIRVLAMASNLFDLRPSYAGYGAALEECVALANARGLYVELVIFADAQIVMPQHETRVEFARDISLWCANQSGVIINCSNEPWKNGFQSATDPQLLDIVRRAAFPVAYSIGDPSDYVADPTVSAEPLAGELDTLAHLSPILVLHAERKSPDGRYAAWVDHLKGFDEAYSNPLQAYRIHDEPMGAASDWQPGRRDNREDAHRAACLVAAVLGIGLTYHYIAEQSDAVPGQDGQRWAKLVPQTPDFRFKNSGTGGACVQKFSGWDKVRTCDNANEGWAVAYGHPGHYADESGKSGGVLRSLECAAGWRIMDRYVIGPCVELYRLVYS